MTSKELARAITALASRAAVRVQDTTSDQYRRPDGSQEFEHMTPERLLEEALDEAADLVAYATMVTLSIERLQTLMSAVRSNGQEK